MFYLSQIKKGEKKYDISSSTKYFTIHYEYTFLSTIYYSFFNIFQSKIIDNIIQVSIFDKFCLTANKLKMDI